MNTVDVGASSPARSSAWRPSLFIAGLLLLVAPFLYANPFNGFHRRVWPWDIWWASPSWDERTEIVGVALVAAMAIATGFGIGRTWLLAVLATLAAFFAIRLHGEQATFTLLSVERLGLSWFASGSVLGVGLLLLSRKHGAARSLGIGLSVLGSIWIVTFLGAWFPRDPAAQGRSMAEFYVRRVFLFWEALFQGGEVDNTTRETLAPLVWGQVVPTIFLCVAVLVALAASFRAALGRAGAGARLAAVAFCCYLATWLIPLASVLILGTDDPGHQGWTGVFGILGNALLDAGLALWLVLVFALTSLLRETHVDRDASSVPLPVPMPRAALRAPFVAAFALSVISLITHFHPDGGFAEQIWPWEVARTFSWNASGAALVFHVFFLALMFAAAVARPSSDRALSRRVLWALAAGVGAALVALEGPIRDESNARRFLFRCPAYVPFVLAALCTATSGTASAKGKSSIRRALGLASGLTLLGILLYPVSLPRSNAALAGVTATEPYASVFTIGWEWARTRTLGDFLVGFEGRYGCPFTTVLLMAVGGIAILGAIGSPGRFRRSVAWSVFALATAWTVVQMFVDPIRGLGDDFSLPLRIVHSVTTPQVWYRCAGAVAFFYLPSAWATVGLTSRALR